ncbi:MAG: hypothetical protein A3J27_13300 [Candidatus Tectomicrobia bacterium RIFCSPLOWO2_12_FULL_69_37]|nr:MAG: hypothetical protein A3I72_13895 [Candidatus Tectomicrobia bacterium RIFCSPLOWO2_02_FULL_70_19]OGL65930.1 MAG: hypothetical protein A3J27_13300 [Candidatus Tectomicrobia bacterium RIFCSPLOWO2_12_FULL_69_37]
MDTPLDHMKESMVPGERPIDKPDLPRQGYVLTIAADTETIEGKLHLRRGRCGKFEVLCDEPGMMGGEGAHPTPLGYISMGVGF